MFDIGWSEILLVAVIAIFVCGPDDIPKLMYNIGRIVRRFRYMRYALSSQFEDFMEKAENSGRLARNQPPAQPDAQPKAEIMDDESDADEHLMDLMPPPEHIPDKPVTDAPGPITEETDDRPKPASTDADRG